MKIQRRLTLGIGILFAMIVLLGIQSVSYVRQLSRATGTILADNYNSLQYAADMLRSLNDIGEDSVSRHALRQSLALQQQKHHRDQRTGDDIGARPPYRGAERPCHRGRTANGASGPAAHHGTQHGGHPRQKFCRRGTRRLRDVVADRRGGALRRQCRRHSGMVSATGTASHRRIEKGYSRNRQPQLPATAGVRRQQRIRSRSRIVQRHGGQARRIPPQFARRPDDSQETHRGDRRYAPRADHRSRPRPQDPLHEPRSARGAESASGGRRPQRRRGRPLQRPAAPSDARALRRKAIDRRRATENLRRQQGELLPNGEHAALHHTCRRTRTTVRRQPDYPEQHHQVQGDRLRQNEFHLDGFARDENPDRVDHDEPATARRRPARQAQRRTEAAGREYPRQQRPSSRSRANCST